MAELHGTINGGDPNLQVLGVILLSTPPLKENTQPSMQLRKLAGHRDAIALFFFRQVPLEVNLFNSCITAAARLGRVHQKYQKTRIWVGQILRLEGDFCSKMVDAFSHVFLGLI